jgi:hypothetical protein
MKLLHAGCGETKLPEWLSTVEETRLDIDPAMKPDVVANMTAMGEIGRYAVVYSCHSLEHLDADGVKQALAEFLRVLDGGGVAIVIVPDLEGVSDTDEVLYDSPAGPITGADMIHGLRVAVQSNPHMAHRSGFTSDSLAAAMTAAGFGAIQTARYPAYNLMAIGKKEAECSPCA